MYNMKGVIDTNKDGLWTFFQQARGIPKEKVKYYLGWLDRFFQFYNGSLNKVSDRDVKAFGDFLEAGGYEECQVKQAQEALFLYIEKFLRKEIVFRDNNREEGNTPAVKTGPRQRSFLEDKEKQA